KIKSRAHHVIELARPARAVVERLAEIQTVADPAAVIHGKHNEALARQILIHRVGVVVVVHVVTADEHLAARSAVKEDDGGAALASGKIARQEKLRVDLHTVGGGNHDRLRRDGLRGGEVRWNRIGCQIFGPSGAEYGG